MCAVSIVSVQTYVKLARTYVGDGDGCQALVGACDGDAEMVTLSACGMVMW
jgi:hypothetical protein